VKAVVAGGGIGGLAAAVSLHRRGIDVVVLERAGQPDTGGAALSLWPNALRDLDRLGIGEQVRQHHRSTAPRTLTSACPAAGVLLAGVVYASRRRPPGEGRPAEEVLAGRYARGEIDTEDLRHRQMVLRGQHAGRRAP
jgi:2-polyprenyl-6-methoxyphenol hydroxylase-like FAD-dependent oxidoreductase